MSPKEVDLWPRVRILPLERLLEPCLSLTGKCLSRNPTLDVQSASQQDRGIGFIGAGLIFVKGDKVTGLTTACHAKVHRTMVVLSAMPPLLLELWREQHPNGHEQRTLDFRLRDTQAETMSMF